MECHRAKRQRLKTRKERPTQYAIQTHIQLRGSGIGRSMGRKQQELKVGLFMAGFAIVVAAICAFDIWLIIHDWLQKASGPLQHQ